MKSSKKAKAATVRAKTKRGKAEPLEVVYLQPLPPRKPGVPYFSQDIDPESLARLPRLASYEGKDPKLQHLVGLLIPTKDVQRLIPVGEREQVWVTMPDGSRERPWLNVWTVERDENGEVVNRDYAANKRVAKRGPRAMSAGDLGAMNMSDHELDQLSQQYLGKPWIPDSLGDSDLRRERFDAVMGVLHARD